MVSERYVSSKKITSFALNTIGNNYRFRIFRAVDKLCNQGSPQDAVYVARDYIEATILDLKPVKAGPAVFLLIDGIYTPAVEFNSLLFEYNLHRQFHQKYYATVYIYEKLNMDWINHKQDQQDQMSDYSSEQLSEQLSEPLPSQPSETKVIPDAAPITPFTDPVKNSLYALINTPKRTMPPHIDVNDFLGKSGVYMIKISDTDNIIHFGTCVDLGKNLPGHIAYIQDVDHAEIHSVIPCDMETATEAVKLFIKYVSVYGIFTAKPFYIVSTSNKVNFAEKMLSYVNRVSTAKLSDK